MHETLVDVAPEILRTGWVSCSSGREELVVMTAVQVEQLRDGVIPCPACATVCGATHTDYPLRADMQVLSWRDGRWQQGVFLSA